MQRIDKDRDSDSSAAPRRAVKPPHPSLLALEPMRASMELLASVGVGPLLRYLPRGDGHPVLVLSRSALRMLRRDGCAGGCVRLGTLRMAPRQAE
jgi:hypothetical protein